MRTAPRRNPDEISIIGSENIEPENVTSTDPRGRVLVLTPLRDAASHLQQHIKLLSELTYPHQSIDLAFLISDSKDDTFSILVEELESLQKQSNPQRFRSAMVIERNFGDTTGQSVDERHSFQAQATRRITIAQSRNYLLYNAIRPVHDWVYWRDVDIVENPSTILEDFMKHDKDILVPSKFESIKCEGIILKLNVIQMSGFIDMIKMAKTLRADVSLRGSLSPSLRN